MENVSVFFIGVFLLLAVWGLVGGVQTQDIGYTCDMGLGNLLCWKWHTNALGEIGQLTGNLIKEIPAYSPAQTDDFTSSLVYDKVNNEFVFTWADNSNKKATYSLVVNRFVDYTNILCDYSSTSSVGYFKCPVVDNNNYAAQSFRTVNGVKTRLDLQYTS